MRFVDSRSGVLFIKLVDAEYMEEAAIMGWRLRKPDASIFHAE